MECVVLYSISRILFHLSIEVFVYIFVNPNSLCIILQKRWVQIIVLYCYTNIYLFKMMVCKSLFWIIFWLEVSVQVSNLYFKKFKYCQNYQFYVKYDNFLILQKTHQFWVFLVSFVHVSLCVFVVKTLLHLTYNWRGALSDE